MLAAAAVAAQFGAGNAGIVQVSPVWFVVYGALVLLFLRNRGLYAWRLKVSALDDVRSVLTATALASTTVLALRILLPGGVDDLGVAVAEAACLSAVYLAAGRVALDWAQLKERRQGSLSRPTLIVGAGRVGHLVAKRLLAAPELGLRPVGFLDKDPLDRPRTRPRAAACSARAGISSRSIAAATASSTSSSPSRPRRTTVLLGMVRRCEQLGVGVVARPAPVRGGPRARRRRAPRRRSRCSRRSAVDPQGWQFAIKYAIDRIVAARRADRCSRRCWSRSRSRVRISARPARSSSASAASGATAASSTCSSSARCATRRAGAEHEFAARSDGTAPAASRATTAARASARSCAAPRSTSCRSC